MSVLLSQKPFSSSSPINVTLFVLTLLGGFWTTPASAYNFHFGRDESVILNTDLNTSTGWSLSGTNIKSGQLTAINPWATANYAITPVELNRGNVFLYWSGIFPIGAKTESDKYYIGLQYAKNTPVCYDSQKNKIVGNVPCSGSSVRVVKENAELKVNIRSKNQLNVSDTYSSLYIDPGFDPINNFSPISTRLNVPTYKENVPLDFRLKIARTSSNKTQALLSFWNGLTWQNLSPKSSYSSPLVIDRTDWLNAKNQVINSILFQSINIQFRQASTRHSAITALAVTQIFPRQSNAITVRSIAVRVPELQPLTILSSITLIALGAGLKRKKQSLRNDFASPTNSR